MPIGDLRSAHRRARARGFTYLALMLVIALWLAGVAGWAQRSQQAAQREREHELLFRGGQIARAIAAYRAATPALAAQPGQGEEAAVSRRQPPGLQALVDDRRGPSPRHHLRQLYADPFTGQPDWVLVTDAQHRLLGVRSRVARVRLLRDAAPDEPGTANGPLLSDWVFLASPERPGDGG